MYYNDNTFNEASIKNYLSMANQNLNIIVEKSVTSTNNVLKNMAEKGALEGTVLIAEMQTNGKGRLGRHFHSPYNTGLYFSILLRPEISSQEALFLTTSAAVAVAKSIEDISNCKTYIKWVNDVYIKDKKVCGILTEGSIHPYTRRLDYAIVGIGINIFSPLNGFPTELKDIAGSIFNHTDFSNTCKSHLTARVIDYFMSYYNNLESKSFFEEYKKRSFLIGRKIYVVDKQNYISATALDITNECHLLVRYEDGSVKELSSGEVSIKLIK